VTPKGGEGTILVMDCPRDVTILRDGKTLSLAVIPGDGEPRHATKAKLKLVMPDPEEPNDEEFVGVDRALKEFETSTKRTILLAFGALGALQVLLFLLDRF